MNVLLSTTSAETITSFVVGVVIIALMIFFIYRKYTFIEKDRVLLDQFLNSIQDIAKKHIIEAIENFDFNNIKGTFGELQAEFVQGMYDDIWDLCVAEIDKLKGNDDILYALLKKVITKEKINDYVITLYSDETIQEKLSEIYNTALKDKFNEIEEEDKKLEQEAIIYDMGEVSDKSHVKKLDPSKVPGAEEEEIIPPVEEESDVVSKDDPTIEVISEDISAELSETVDEDNSNNGEPV